MTASPSRRDREILRELARLVVEAAAEAEQADKVRLWTACNDLAPERAMVLADPQNGWTELDAAWLQLECEDAECRGLEHALRRKLIRHRHIPDDFPIVAELEVGVQVSGAGYGDYGVDLGVERSAQTDGAYHIEPAIRTEADLDRLHQRPIRIDSAATDRAADRVRDLLGDLVPVRRRGRTSWRYGLTRVLIHMRGLDQMMLDMYDEPALMHRLMAFLRDDFLRELGLFEAAGEVALNNLPDRLTGSGGLCSTADLPGADLHETGLPGSDAPGPPPPDPRTSGTPPSGDECGREGTLRHCLCWGESQETVGVGPGQFDEFVLQYQLPLLSRFGLVDYGCCEPLDHKYDLLTSQIPHLRWLSVPPWADRALAAEKIGDRYVYVYKPNPAHICSPDPDWAAAETELRETLEIARDCPVHLVMKDTNTFCHEPGRITRWAEMASLVAREMV